MHFIALQGFRPAVDYDMRPGERQKPPDRMQYDKVQINWKHAKSTAGLDFVLETCWPELADLRLAEQDFL